MAQEITCLERVVFAFRGDLDGSYKGAHAEYFTRIVRDDGTEIARQNGRATTIDDLNATGFTWPDVVSGINMGLLLANEAQKTSIATLISEKEEIESALISEVGKVKLLSEKNEELTSYIAVLNKQNESLAAELAEAKTRSGGLKSFVGIS